MSVGKHGFVADHGLHTDEQLAAAGQHAALIEELEPVPQIMGIGLHRVR